MSERSADVLVIGGGAIGCAVAWELARRGVACAVVERGTPGQAATWAAAGMLSPLGEASEDARFRALATLGLDRYPAFAEALRAETGIDVEYRASGKLHLAFGRADTEHLETLAARGEEEGAERLSPAQARSLEPLVSPDIEAAVLVRRDHRVDNRRLGAALWAAAAQAGVRFRLGSPAVELKAAGGATARVTGVVLEDGTTLTAERVVVAAGAWSGNLRGLPRPLPVRPVRGQMFAVRITGVPDPYAPVKPALRRTIMTEGCYIVPREGGTVVVGATVEDVGFAPGPTPRGIAGLLVAATRAVPALADLPLVETWAGFRPGTPDGLPILGPDPDVVGLYYATGHYRNGILLTPATALLVADELTGPRPALPLEGFGVERFEGVVR